VNTKETKKLELYTAFVKQTYGLLPDLKKCKILHEGINDIYKIATEKRNYILRISRNKRFIPYNEESYAFELHALEYLHNKGIAVNYPIKGLNGKSVQTITENNTKRFCCLLSYQIGSHAIPLNKDQYFAAGRLLAQIHNTLDSYVPIHARFTLDHTFLFDKTIQLSKKYLSGNERMFIRDLEIIRNKVSPQIMGYRKTAKNYGIIHGDYWNNNILIDAKNKMSVIDFDYMGFGWRIYDLSSLFITELGFERMRSVWNPNRKPLHFDESDQASILLGYESLRDLTAEELAKLPYFKIARLFWWFGLYVFLSQQSKKHEIRLLASLEYFLEFMQDLITSL